MRVEVDTLKERGHVEPLRICEKSVRRFSYSYSCGAARRNRARHVPIIFFNRLNSLAPFFRILAVAFSRLSRRKAVSRSSIVNDEARTAPPRGRPESRLPQPGMVDGVYLAGQLGMHVNVCILCVHTSVLRVE